MKLFRRLSALAMVLALLLSMSISVFAAEFDNMDEGFAYDGADTDVNITIDTTDGGYYYTAQEGKTYTISGSGELAGGSFAGSGTVEINTAVTSDLDASGTVQVTVKDGVDGSVYANDNASVSVGGKVAGDVVAYGEANVSVSGDVNGVVYAEGYAVDSADGSATLTVGGDVDGGAYAEGSAELTIVGDVNGGVYAEDSTFVSVGGDVNGCDGDPGDVDYDDPGDYSDGKAGVMAYGNATVTVGGNVTGGDAYGTYGYGGVGIYAMEYATVSVDGNVTGGDVIADPNTESDGYESWGGSAIYMDGTGATVTVGGNATGGSTNGDAGKAGSGIYIDDTYFEADEAGSVAVGGAVTGGTAPENGTEGMGIEFDLVSEDTTLPELTVGSYDSIGGSAGGEPLTEEQLNAIKAEIKIAPKAQPGESVQVADTFWPNLIAKIRKAQPGDEITVNVYGRKSIPASVIEAVRQYDVKLIIKWNGGDDLVITKDFTAEVKGNILLKDLAEMLKK